MQELGFENSRRRYDEENMEVKLDISEDSVPMHSLRPSPCNEDPGKSLLEQGRPVKKSNSVWRRIASSVSSALKRVVSSVSLTGPPRPPLARFPRSDSKAKQAIKGLKFITSRDGVAGWPGVEKEFDKLTEKTNGVLHRSQFGTCIGK